METAQPHFFSNRSDGLGQRLWAMINAFVLSNKIGGAFSFHWPTDQIHGLQDHAISEVHEIFSGTFIKEFHKAPPTQWVSIADEEFRSNLETPLVGNFLSEPISIKTRLPYFEITYRDYQRAISEIGFSDRINSAIRAVDDFDLANNSIAVHMRAGDIVYGKYRFDDRFTSKVVSFPLIEYEIDAARKDDREILIFGQDKKLCDHLTQAYGLTHPYYSEEPDLQAVFEIFLMSRCHTIYCGHSGFAQLAASIGGSTTKYPCENKNAEEKLKIYETHLSRCCPAVTPLQRAFAYWSSYLSCTAALNLEQQSRILTNCCNLDPSNDFYKVVLASILFSDGRFNDAEKILEKCSGKNVDGALWRVLKPTPSGPSRAERYLKSFAAPAAHGSYMANQCLGITHFFNGEYTSATRHLNRCITQAPDRRNANTERLMGFLKTKQS